MNKGSDKRMKTAFIIDSTAGLTDPTLLNHPDVYIVNLSIHFEDGQTFLDTSDPETLNQLYEAVAQQKIIPTTSQPALGDYYALVESLIEKGYESIIAIHLSSRLSGTYQSAQMILEEYNDQINTACIDSKSASVVMMNLLESGLYLVERGDSFEDIVQTLEDLVANSYIYILVGGLDHLVKGGRLSQGSALLGNLLRINPLLKVLDDGTVEVVEKVRTRRRAHQRYIDLVKEYVENHPGPVRVFLAHTQNEKEMKEVKELIESAIPSVKVQMENLTPVIGVHLGAGCLGLGLTLDIFSH